MEGGDFFVVFLRHYMVVVNTWRARVDPFLETSYSHFSLQIHEFFLQCLRLFVSSQNMGLLSNEHFQFTINVVRHKQSLANFI